MLMTAASVSARLFGHQCLHVRGQQEYVDDVLPDYM